VPYLSPQPDPVNPLQLNMRVPMPTRESRDEALKAASKAGEIASLAVKAARATTQKRLRAMELKKAVRPDDLRKAHVKMEEIVQKATADAKREVEDTRKLMDRPAPNP
jgi:ribosome recycling factor